METALQEMPEELIKERDYVVTLKGRDYLVPEPVAVWIADMWQLYASTLTRVQSSHILQTPEYMQPKCRRVDDGD